MGTEVPVALEVLDPILDHLPQSGFLFPSSGKHGVRAPRTALQGLKAALIAIGIDEAEQHRRNLGVHALRHTWETPAKAAGLSAEIRSGFTEHRDEKTSERYTHLKAVNLLDALPVQRNFLVS